MKSFNGLISKFLSDTKFQEYADLSDIQYNRDDPEQAFIIRNLQYCAERLEDVHIAINYYNLPIIETSYLKMGSDGRHHTESGYTYTSGTGIEFLATDSYHEKPYWATSRVESNSEGYYIVNFSSITMNGLTVRRRGL